jgi:uncharacterized protein (DUF1810 family)
MNDLNRFRQAQQGNYAIALAEIKAGRKRSHWMWYIFPQLKGLGFSETAQVYGLDGEAEAAAYLADSVLGDRLLQISAALLQLADDDPYQVFGNPDDLKLHSCMTLFANLPGTDPVFQAVLDKYYAGAPDPQTLRLLGRAV